MNQKHILKSILQLKTQLIIPNWVSKKWKILLENLGERERKDM